MRHGTLIRTVSALMILGALSVGACVREQPIYQAQNHMIPAPTSTPLSLEQIEARIAKAAKAKGWYVDHRGPGEMLATKKWGVNDKHVAVVKIEYNLKSFNILHVRSVNLAEGIADADHTYAGQKVIHRRRNAYVHELESAIDLELYGSAT